MQVMVMGFIFAVLIMGSVTVLAETPKTIEVTYGVNVVVDGVLLNFSDDIRPFTSEGRTFLPIRGIADALGLDMKWDASTSTAYLFSRILTPAEESMGELGSVMVLTEASQTIEVTYDVNVIVDGVSLNSWRPFISEGRTYLPIGGIANALGLDVRWDYSTSTAYFSSRTPTELQPLTGSWHTITNPGIIHDFATTITFKEDGTVVFHYSNYKYTYYEFTYEIESDQYSVTLEDSLSNLFSIDENTLVLVTPAAGAMGFIGFGSDESILAMLAETLIDVELIRVSENGNDENNDSLVGRWKVVADAEILNTIEFIEFRENGTVLFETPSEFTMEGIFLFEEGLIYLAQDDGMTGYTFTISENSLTLFMVTREYTRFE